MSLNFMDDALAAGLIWRLLVLVIAAVMWLALRNEDEEHEWWGEAMVRLKMAHDEWSAVESSRTFFRWATIVALVLVLWQSGRLFHRAYPDFPFSRTVHTTPEKLPPLPDRPGASGSGTVIPGKTPLPTGRDGAKPKRESVSEEN